MGEEAINKILLELQNTKTELKKTIKDSETRILEELETKVKKLEEENAFLREAIQNYEIKSKKKNIIVFGVKKEAVRNVSKLCEDLNQVLETNICERDINDVYSMGKGENCPIKIEFISFLRKKHVLANLKKLKGTKIGISDDMTKNQQEELKKLRKHLKIVREQQPEESSYIRGFKLYIGYVGYTAKQLDDGEYIILEKRSNSAPATPMIDRDLDEVFDVHTHQQLKENKVKKIDPNENPAEGNRDIIINQKKTAHNSASNQGTPKSTSNKKAPAVGIKRKTSSSDANRAMTRSTKN